MFAYADNYLIDLKCAIIVDVEPTTAIRQAEVTAAKTMIRRTAERLGIEPERLAADTGYGSAEMLGWLVEECESYVEQQRFSVVRDFCGHGIGRRFHEASNVLHFGRPWSPVDPPTSPRGVVPDGVRQAGDAQVGAFLPDARRAVLDAVGLLADGIDDLEIAVLKWRLGVAAAGEVPAGDHRPVLDGDMGEGRVVGYGGLGFGWDAAGGGQVGRLVGAACAQDTEQQRQQDGGQQQAAQDPSGPGQARPYRRTRGPLRTACRVSLQADQPGCSTELRWQRKG